MKKKGFTLIELLAVIIILGILMLIAIPSVTSYINNSRKNTYVDTINEMIKGTVIRVNNGDLDMFDTNTTYYIPTSAIDLESGKMQSPYGKIENDAYVVVTYDGESYDYYYVGKDTANVGIGEITKKDNISTNSIQTDIGTIDTTIGIEGKEYVVVFTGDLEKGDAQLASRKVSGNGPSGQSSNSTDEIDTSNLVTDGLLCKRATYLNHGTCGVDWGCYYGVEGEGGGEYVTFGQLGSGNEVNPGDAYVCDVNADGIYDEDLERFYYVGKTYNGSNNTYYEDRIVMIYSKTVKDGTTPTKYDIFPYPSPDSDSVEEGPTEAYKQLPDKTQWVHPRIIKPGVRQLTNEEGGRTTDTWNDTELPTFNYGNKAARLLTIQEVSEACGITTTYSNAIASTDIKENCLFLMDGQGPYTEASYEWWLESYLSYWGENVWYVTGDPMSPYMTDIGWHPDQGMSVRPAIDIYLTDLEVG